MQYNQNPSPRYDPFSQAPVRANQGEPGKDKDEKESGGRWWIRYVIVPIIVALIGTGVFFGVKSANNPTPTPTPTSPAATIPILHSTYSGTYIDLAIQREDNLSLINLSEDTNTGNFTAAAEDGVCTAQITNGTVDTGGHVTFQLDQEFNPNTGCQTLVVDFTGQVNSAGDISGQWTEENTQFNGTFHLS